MKLSTKIEKIVYGIHIYKGLVGSEAVVAEITAVVEKELKRTRRDLVKQLEGMRYIEINPDRKDYDEGRYTGRKDVIERAKELCK